ncbi:nuclease-related domain-containing protein [Pseudoneobacillus sp. C159]
MPFKSRNVPSLLRKLRILDNRMELSANDQLNYFYQEKGYQGELQFDALTEKLPNNIYIINDLLLRIGTTECQIDTAMICFDVIKLFEIKNFEGEFIYFPDKLQKLSEREINYQNPLGQLNRTKILFQQQLYQIGCNLHVEAYVVFINPNFTLFHAPHDLPFILPTQINSLLRKLNNQPGRLGSRHIRLAEQLVSLHLPEPTAPPQLPTFNFKSLLKGISCKQCFHLTVVVNSGKAICRDCGYEETLEAAVVRNVGEIQLLFPNKKITTNVVFEWCGVVTCRKRIYRILRGNFDISGTGQWAYFTDMKNY